MTELQKAIKWLEEMKAQAEQIIEESKNLPYAINNIHRDKRIDDCRVLLDALKWIPVSERLPTEELASVLVYTKDGGVSEGQYYPTIKSWKQFRWSVENATVTHWMPLPKPPESEG